MAPGNESEGVTREGGQTRLIYLVPKAPVDRDRPLVVLLLLDIFFLGKAATKKKEKEIVREEGRRQKTKLAKIGRWLLYIHFLHRIQ